MELSPEKKDRLFRTAFLLAIATIVYNLAEGIISTWLGLEDESLALAGFGLDSFIEMISGLGIARMVGRFRQQPDSTRGRFEKTALMITGTAFYLLAAGLTVSSIANIILGRNPETTFWGVIISLVSIVAMLGLIRMKTKVGRALNSKAILADAACTRVCVYMSVILLLSSALYEIFGIPYIDSIATLGLAWFSFTEGRECFEKAGSCEDHCSSCG